jgi:hypothetical protein
VTDDPAQPADGKRPADLPRYRGERFGRDAFDDDDRYASEPFAAARRSPARVLIGLLVGVVVAGCVGALLFRFVNPKSDPAAEQAGRQGVTQQANPPRTPDDPLASLKAAELRPADGQTGSLKMGTSLLARDGAGNALRVTVDHPKLWTKGCEPYAGGGAGGGYLVADVTVEVLEGAVSFTEYDFGLRPAAGKPIVSAGGGILTGCGEPLDADGLKPGDGRSGRLVFTADTLTGQIVYLPIGRSPEPVGTWTVA